MFKKLYISAPRALFWLVSNVFYWALIFFAQWETRFRVFLGAEIFLKLSARKGFSEVMSNIGVLEKDAWAAMADTAPLPGIFLLVPLVMATLMFFAPFFVRRDYRGAVRGVFMLPITAVLCYIFASLMNLVVAASINLVLYLYLQIKPGADFFTYLAHPLYLLAPPAMKNFPGLMSQCVYLLFITSVLTTPGRRRWVPAADEGEYDPGELPGDTPAAATKPDIEENSNYNAYVMEMDRLCRIVEMRTGQPSLAHSIRAGISDYIDVPANFAKAEESGFAPYKIVLIEAAKSLKSTMDEDPGRQGASDTFAYIINEMERMEYCTARETATLREWLERRNKKAAPPAT